MTQPGQPVDQSARVRRKAGLITAVAVVALAVIISIVVVAGKPHAGPKPSPYAAATDTYKVTESGLPGDRKREVAQRMMTDRIAALRSGDEAAWLAPLDPANADLVKQERLRFVNLRQFELASYDLKVELNFIPVGTDESKPITQKAWVNQIFRFASDVQLSVNRYSWTLLWVGDQVRVTAIETETGIRHDEGADKNPPWDETELRSARGNGVTVFAPVASKWNPAAYVGAANRAAALVRSLFKGRQSAPQFVVFLADNGQFERWFGSTVTDASTIGLAVFPRMVEADGQLRFARNNKINHKANEPAWLERNAGSRIVLRMPEIDRSDVEHVLAHEMAHAIGPHLISATSSDYTGTGEIDQSTWAIEGFARYVEHLADPAETARGMAFVRSHWAKNHPRGADFPANKGFYSTSDTQTHFNYELGSSIYHAAEKVGGRRKAVDLYIALTNQMQLTSDTRLFLAGTLQSVGLNPGKVFSAQRALIG